MVKIHPVSPCCRAGSRRFGGRRQQCVSCGKTWRVFRHKRGRKTIRITSKLAERTVSQGVAVRHVARLSSTRTLRTTQQRLKRSLDILTARLVPDRRYRGSYILIADGLWYSFKGKDWVLYLMLLKPRRRNYAILLEPVILPVRELFENWRQALETIPAPVRKCISVFVSDHFSASEKIADTFNWIHQLCHFHLLSELHRRRGKRKVHIPGSMMREEIYQGISQLLRGDDTGVERRLCRLVRDPQCPRKIAMIAREFLRVKNRYHAYLLYPALTIPKTTNPVESLNQLLRKRTWMLRSPESVLQWATAFVRLRKNMVCNGTYVRLKNQPN